MAGDAGAGPEAVRLTGPAVELLARVREIAGTEDVERLDVPPATAVYDDRTLHPDSVIRVGPRLFAEMREHPGEWWMGELDADGVLRVWGSYGSLEEAVRHH